MSIWRLILREILYRKANFVLSMLAIIMAVACVVAAIASLCRYDLHTEQLAVAQEAELRKRMAALEDNYRKITKNLGFNILILPKDQNLSDLYAEDFASKDMPESYAEQLTKAKVASINHILPLLQQKLKWPERERTIMLAGTRGEVPSLDKDAKKPILDLVPPGSAVLGYELHRSLKLAAGAKIVLLGREFSVARLQPERGNKDDITLWINLADAQKLLGKEGRINAILALECLCAADRLSTIRAEIAGILPETQVIEFGTQALARAEARNHAAAEAREAIERDKLSRANQRAERERLFAILVPLVLIACATWAGLLAYGNVRGRLVEIGILRALGLRSSQILTLFLGRAMLIGLLGACVGFAAGWLGSWGWDMRTASGEPLGPLFDSRLCALLLVLTPLFSAVVSWLPAMLAAQQHPAEALRPS
jgi:hypothetical protein